MSNVLAVYGSSYGQTEKIINRISARLTEVGLSITLLKGDVLPQPLSLDRFDGFLVGASVERGRHQRYVEDFVRRNVTRLNGTRSAFVSVSGSAGSPAPENQAAARRYVEKFLELTGWRPSLNTTFGGAMAYTRYGFFLRWTLWFISRRRGGPTDTSRDHEQTDWPAVDEFALKLAALFHSAIKLSS